MSAKKKPEEDSEQLRLDLDTANARLERVAGCIRARDAATAEVRACEARLRQAKRRLVEAEWSLSVALAAEMRR